MAKDLSGTNVAAQKAQAYYKPAFLVELVRDHPETGESPAYYTSWSGKLILSGTSYADRILSLGEVSRSIQPGGGMALVSDWILRLTNPENLPAGGRLSDMLDNWFLENDEIRLSLVFRDGVETDADLLRLFTGQVQQTPIRTRHFEIRAKDATKSLIKSIPQELTDLIRFPYAPLNVANLPFPVPFGNLNVEPFNTTGARAVLAPCRMTDIFAQQWTSGLIAKTYGQSYVFYRSARMYARIEGYTQTGALFTVDTSERFSKIKPIRPALTNDVSDWKNALDGNTSTGSTIASGDNLDFQVRGCPKLGTLTAITAEVVATGSYGYTITKTGESNITGSGSGSASIDLSGWDFSDDWDFEQIEILLDGPGSGSATINLVTLDITYDEQETGDNLAFPVFQSVVGYQDLAAQYTDGGVIVSSGQALRNPLDVALAWMRDKRTGMRMAAAQIDTSNLAAERAKLSDWKFDFSLDDTLSPDGFSSMLRQGRLRLFRTYDNKWKFSVFDKTDAPVAAFFDAINIAVTNPQAPPDQRESSFQLDQAPLAEVYNEIVLQYGWDGALGTYTQQLVASPHYLLTGTATLDAAAGTLTDTTTPATFISDGVQVGYKVFVIRDKLYQVDAVNSETELAVSAVDPALSVADYSDTYYIGPNFNYTCFRSVQKYKLTQRLTIQSRFIQDDATAALLLAHLVDYWSARPFVATFRTWLNAVDLEVGDLILIDHPDLPPRKRPVTLGVLSANISQVVTTFAMSNAGLVRGDDRLIFRPGDSRLYRECAEAVSVDDDAGTVTVTRGAYGSTARPWSATAKDEVQRVITKWEVVGLRTIPKGNGGIPEIEVTARETPRDYTPAARYAPEDLPAFADAAPSDRARYGFYSYPNGEIVWLDEESDVSRYAPEP